MHMIFPLLQAAATFPDTIVTKQVQPVATTFDKVTTYASGLASIALLVLAVALVPEIGRAHV